MKPTLHELRQRAMGTYGDNIDYAGRSRENRKHIAEQVSVAVRKALAEPDEPFQNRKIEGMADSLKEVEREILERLNGPELKPKGIDPVEFFIHGTPDRRR